MPDPKRVPDARPQKIKMTPAIVERLLAANDHNRNLRTNVVMSWKGTFIRGEYRPMADDPVKVRGTVRVPGRLQDGQHRLHGLWEAFEEDPDLEVTMWIWENVPDDTQDIMGTGIKRSLGDVLKLRGEREAVQLAAVINLSARVERGRLIGGGGQLTNVQLLDHFDKNEWLRDGLSQSKRITKVYRVAQSGVGYALSCAMHASNEAVGEDFTDLVVHGVNLTAGHPVLRLRTQFTEWTRQRPGAGAGPLNHVVAATTINTWNLWRLGEVSVNPSWIRWEGGDFPAAQ